MTIAIINGARQSFGVNGLADNVEPAHVVHAGVKKQLVIPFVYNGLPGGYVGDHSLSIPAKALVTAAYCRIITDFNSTSGTTTIDVGLVDNTNTEIDLDGLLVDVGGAADGSNAGFYVGAGADIGTVPSATLAGYVKVSPSVSDLTAGKAVIVIEYIDVIV